MSIKKELVIGIMKMYENLPVYEPGLAEIVKSVEVEIYISQI